jgi:hypothetical protein
MSPFAIDESRMQSAPGSGMQLVSLDPSKPPVKQIPHMEFPRVVYKHPKEPFKIVVHRNQNHEIVEEERIPAEHLTKTVNDAKELAAALKDGWVKEPYLPQAPEDPNASLYDEPEAEK